MVQQLGIMATIAPERLIEGVAKTSPTEWSGIG
jgi:hypothetical protein